MAATLLLWAAPAGAQTAGDLVAKNLAARGGAEKLAALQSVEFVGKIVVGGDFELGYKEIRSRTGPSVRYDLTLQGITQVQAYDGKMAWRVDPFGGRRDAERMPADDARALADGGTIDGPLLSARADGSTVAYLGREDFDGTDAYKLRVVQKDGAEYTYYLDPDTYLEIKVVEERTLRGARQVNTSEYGDYELVNGVYFPFSISTQSGNLGPYGGEKITIASARANISPGAATFAMPPSPPSSK
jgi:hypothetical protein